MKNLRIYRVDINYIKYLWTHDNKVQFRGDGSDEYNGRRPYIGIVFEINNIQYFAPLEHPKQSHKFLKSNPHIVKIYNGKFGILALGNMIPVPKKYLIEFNIDDEDENYKKILKTQFIFFKKNLNHIIENAKKTYETVTVEKIDFFVRSCCDFKKLENEYLNYTE